MREKAREKRTRGEKLALKSEWRRLADKIRNLNNRYPQWFSTVGFDPVINLPLFPKTFTL